MYELKPENRNSLVEKIANLLSEYDYNYSTYNIGEIVDIWAANKGSLIEAFSKHPNYIDGEFMIAFDVDFERSANEQGLKDFQNWLMYIITQMINDIPQELIEQRQKEYCAYLPRRMYDWLNHIDDVKNQFLTEEQATEIAEIFPESHAHTGQKTSRVVNKICTYLGYNKHPEYNREFAKYADALNPLKIKRHTVISLNPLDYLTMSFGNSWASCHTIDKNNKRGMPNNYSGCYSSGTLSYMLDKTSMVFYTVDASYDGTEYYTQPKINRQMFHYGEEKLVQGRLYPQDNDCNPEEYTPYRNIVQAVMAHILDVPNLWTLSKGTENASRYICSYGTHYRDYMYYANCTLSRIKGSENENYIDVGNNPICPNCGCHHEHDDNILCEECAHDGNICENCGCVISDDDTCWIGDYPYCCDCVTYCSCCDEYVLNDDATYIDSEDRYVCNYCLNKYYSYCEECREYYSNDEIYYIENEYIYVCPNCFDEHFCECYECGEYIRNEDAVEIDGETYCEKCASEKEENEEEIA